MFGSENRNLRVLVITIGIAAIGYLYRTLQYVPAIQCPIVNSTLGSVQGYTALSRDGREYFAFLGIPFAEAPMGDLRFEPPQPAKKWEGVRSAMNFGADCAHMSLILGFIESYDEDCLFLNVYTPARNLSDLEKRFSVMVYFYGGMFMEGKSSVYGPSYFMDEDIVLVTVNYRIGALGFLNTGDGIIRGNMGLKDQNAGLRWVKENIEAFGGNARDITIFGQSAGSASVHYHILSPMSKGLFTKAISQSGVALNPWALTIKPKEQAFRLGGFLNCPNETVEALVRCLKNVPVKDILATHSEVLSILRDPISVYTPSIEVIKDSNTFLADHPLDILKSGRFSKVPWMTGVTGEEGLIASTMVIRNSSLTEGDLEGWKALAKNGLFYTKENKELTNEIKEYYFGDAECVADLGIELFFKNLTTLFSDRHFFTGFATAINLHSAHAPTFPYFYNYTGQFTITNMLLAARGESHILVEIVIDFVTSWFKKTFIGIEPKNYGVCHTDDLFLLFELFPPFLSIRNQHGDYELSKSMVDLWTSFAKTQYPKGKMPVLGTNWEEINPEVKMEDINYLLIDNGEFKIIKAPFANRLQFWISRDDKF